MTYHFQTNSNAAPFFSDNDSGFIESNSAMSALKELVSGYKHPAGLYSAMIEECSPKKKLLARYLSPRAATSTKAGSGVHEWKDDGLYVNSVKAAVYGEEFENFESVQA